MHHKLFIIVNEDRFFLSHRKDIAVNARKSGYDVTIVCKDTGRMKEVTDLGLSVIELPINPTGMNLMEELKTFLFLLKLYRSRRPDIVHHVGLKNILWGGLAAKLARVHGVVNAVSGLGVMFSGSSLSFTAKAVLSVMRFSNRGMNVTEIFQNSDDRQLFLSRKVTDESHCAFIKGSGVDLNEYCHVQEPSEGRIRILFTARMVKEKGLLTLIEAAQKLRGEYEKKVEFILCGFISNNPSGIKEEELKAMCDGSYIQYLGFRRDVCNLLKSSHIVAFPSYYREGVPRSLIEACAVGRPIITCDSIGCKDTVDDGVNGYLIQPRDSEALADRLRILIEDKALRERMGNAGRLKAETEFSVANVVNEHLRIYSLLS